MERFLFTFLKGAWIGGTLTVPGVSGGSMAMILGIYSRLIKSVNSLISYKGERRESLRFLLVFSFGALSGILALSGVVVWLLNHYPVLTVFFFAGAVAGGIPVVLYEIKTSLFRWYHLLYFFCGILLVIMISMVPQGLFAISDRGFLWQVLGGLIAAAALVLPGISVSHMLYVLGIYESLMTAISNLNILVLIPFAAGTLAGTILMSKLVEYLLNDFKTSTYLIILGFVVGSVFELFSGIRPGQISWGCIPLFVMGFLCLFALYKKGRAGA